MKQILCIVLACATLIISCGFTARSAPSMELPETNIEEDRSMPHFEFDPYQAYANMINEYLEKNKEKLISLVRMQNQLDLIHEENSTLDKIYLRGKTTEQSVIDEIAWVFPDVETKKDKTIGEKKEFGRDLYEIAKHYEENGSNVPAELLVCMAVLESGWGTSHAARKHNNLFGVKGDGCSDCSYGAPYSCIQDSVEDYIRILNLSRYQHLHGTDFYNWIDGLGSAGYHESGTDYAATMRSILRLLQNWDIVDVDFGLNQKGVNNA